MRVIRPTAFFDLMCGAGLLVIMSLIIKVKLLSRLKSVVAATIKLSGQV